MRALIFLVALSLAGCATNSLQLNADKAIILGETSFIAVKQVALAGIQSGMISGTNKAKVIALVDQGQVFENNIVAGNNVAGNIASLSSVIAELGQLGVKVK